MAFELPQSRRPIRQIQIQKKNVPIDQIIAVKGKSPISTGIDVAGNVIGQALARRAALRQQGVELARQQEQTKQIARALGVDDKDFSTLSPDQAVTVGKYVNEQRRREEATPRIRLLEKQGGFKEGELGDDYDAAKAIFTQNAITKRMNENPNLANRGRAQENTLRAQYIGQSRQFKDISEGYQRVLDSSKNPSPAGDLAMIFNYMKILDPTSVVRESEFAQAAATGSYGQRIQAAVQRVINGKRLSDEQRNDFIFQAQQIYSGQERLQAQRDSEFERVAIESGIEPKRIMLNMRAQPSLQSLPMPGQETPAQRKARLLQELQGAR